jgi:hypothetical protein
MSLGASSAGVTANRELWVRHPPGRNRLRLRQFVEDEATKPFFNGEPDMRNRRCLKVGAAALLAVSALIGATKAGSYYYRQYYGGWNYYPQYGYYYNTYHYQPYENYEGYNYHYSIYYPSYPNYVYYYNPYQHQYWGRLDIKGKPGHQYSLLAQQDRKKSLKDIPESAFPEAGKMPPIPESKDGTPMEAVRDLPKPGTGSGPSLPGP